VVVYEVYDHVREGDEKGHKIFGQKKCTPPRENRGYAYVVYCCRASVHFAHTLLRLVSIVVVLVRDNTRVFNGRQCM